MTLANLYTGSISYRNEIPFSYLVRNWPNDSIWNIIKLYYGLMIHLYTQNGFFVSQYNV